MNDLDLLATFLAVYRHGSLSSAATELGVSQPAVSGQLCRLERRRGQTLFVRSARGVVPTDQAHDLAHRVGPHLDRLVQALGVAAQPAPPLGPIRLGAAADILAARIVPALAPLTADGLVVHALCATADVLLRALLDDELDLVVSSVRPRSRAIIATPLIDEEFVLVGSPAFARTVDPARLAVDPVRALAHLPLVAYAPELPIIRRYWRSEFGRRPANRVAMTVADLRAVLAAVIAGAGVSVLPRYLAEPAISSGSVQALHQPTMAPLNTLYLATRVGSTAPHRHSVSIVHDHLIRKARQWGTL
jgi:DNA-binding transcriptional LysR family regulator